jgi:hypothetical protein
MFGNVEKSIGGAIRHKQTLSSQGCFRPLQIEAAVF